MLCKIIVWILVLDQAVNSTATYGVPCKSNDLKCIQAARLSQSWYSYYITSLFSGSTLLLMTIAVALGVYISKLVYNQSALPWKLYQYQSRIFLINQKNGEVISDVDDVEKLRTQLMEVEKEREELKAELEKYRAAEDIDSVTGRKWEETDRVQLLTSSPRMEIENGALTNEKLAVVVSKRKFELTNADYSRKCRYLTKKLKDTEALIKTMKNQVEMAKEIKAEFNELKEQRTEMGRQVVALTREKRDAKQKVLTLQTDMRTWRKQMDCVVTRNTELLKQVEQLNNSLKQSSREKKNLKRLAENAAEELDLARVKLDSIHKEKEELVKKVELLEMEKIASLENNTTRSVDVLSKNTSREVQVYTAQVHKRSNFVRPIEKETRTKVEVMIGKADENDSTKSKNVGLNIVKELKNEDTVLNKSLTIKELERSLMKLERSVEENMKLRTSAMSMISNPIELTHIPEELNLQQLPKSDEKVIELPPSDTESIPCLYAGIPISAVHIPSEISCIDTSIGSIETAAKRSPSSVSTVSACGYHDSKCSLTSSDEGESLPRDVDDGKAAVAGMEAKKKEPEHEISVCCMDSQCSVCSVPGCTVLHVSCSDVTCLTTVSSMEMKERAEMDDAVGEVGASRQVTEEPSLPPMRRSTGVERLADIFGNGPIGEGGPWNIPGLSTIMLNTAAVRPTGSVVVNAGSQAVSSVGEVGDGFSSMHDNISSSEDSVGSAGSLMANASDVTYVAAVTAGIITPATAPQIVVRNSGANNNSSRKFSCFTNNDSRVVSNSLAFRQFLNEMAVVTDDPDIGDEGAVVE